MPAKGWPRPQSRFCSAIASAKTSRLQPLALVMGVRKKPMVERGPKVRIAIRQPQTMTTAAGTAGAAARPGEAVVIDGLTPAPTGD